MNKIKIVLYSLAVAYCIYVGRTSMCLGLVIGEVLVEFFVEGE